MTRVLVGLARRKLGAIAVAGCLVVAACGGGDENLDYVERPVDELYNEAKDLLDAREFEEAAYGFEEVERQHPYSEWAVRAQLMAAYSFYQARMYDDSVAAADRFIELHPGNDDVPYAYYLVGTSYYEQISDVGRDQEMTRQALDSFDELVRRFPDSSYARDAELKIDLARDHLAGKQMEIGRFYLNREEYVAAINRFRTVIDDYQTTTHVPEALHRLTEAYLALGVFDEARRNAAVLGYNYPDSKWYRRSYALLEEEDLPPLGEEETWLSSVF